MHNPRNLLEFFSKEFDVVDKAFDEDPSMSCSSDFLIKESTSNLLTTPRTSANFTGNHHFTYKMEEFPTFLEIPKNHVPFQTFRKKQKLSSTEIRSCRLHNENKSLSSSKRPDLPKHLYLPIL